MRLGGLDARGGRDQMNGSKVGRCERSLFSTSRVERQEANGYTETRQRRNHSNAPQNGRSENGSWVNCSHHALVLTTTRVRHLWKADRCAAFKRRHCLVPAFGFYESRTVGKQKLLTLLRPRAECRRWAHGRSLQPFVQWRAPPQPAIREEYRESHRRLNRGNCTPGRLRGHGAVPGRPNGRRSSSEWTTSLSRPVRRLVPW